MNQFKIRIHVNEFVRFINQSKKTNLSLHQINQKNHYYTFYIDEKDLKQLKEIIHLHSLHSLVIIHRKSIKHKFMKWLNRPEYVLAVTLAIIFFILLSNIIWKLDVVGVTPEVEVKIKEELKKEGVYEGAFKQYPSYQPLERLLLSRLTNLQFLKIEEIGNYIQVEAKANDLQLAKENEEVTSYVANKNGYIHSFYIEKGIPQVARNEYVKKGDPLITTYYQTDDEQIDVFPYVFGEVFANTWYEVSISQPKRKKLTLVDGVKSKQHELCVFQLCIPLYNIFKKDNQITDFEEKTLRFIHWDLPVTIRTKINYHTKELGNKAFDKKWKKELVLNGLKELQRSLGNDSEILMYHVLYDTMEGNNRKLKLYISVIENIAEPIEGN